MATDTATAATGGSGRHDQAQLIEAPTQDGERPPAESLVAALATASSMSP